MKLHYGGRYKDEKDLKVFGESHEGEVAFREHDQKKFALIANAGSAVLVAALLVPVFLFGTFGTELILRICVGSMLSLLIILPHEFLHALCFKGDVYLYYDPSKMIAFVHGAESMSKARFIFMSLLPNIVFGVIPYVLFLFIHDLTVLGAFGAVCIGMGFGDYVNVFNAATQMPKGAKTFLKGFHSYWYLPKKGE